MEKRSTLKTVFSWLVYKEKKTYGYNKDLTSNDMEKSVEGKAGTSAAAEYDAGNKSGDAKAGSPKAGGANARGANEGSVKSGKANSTGKAAHTPKTGDNLLSSASQAKRKKNDSSEDTSNKTKIYPELAKNLSYIEQAFNHPENKDIILRRLCIDNGVNAFIFYLDGMADRNTINLSILRPLLDKSKYNDKDDKNLFDFVYDSIIETHQLEKANVQQKAINDVLTGNTALCIDGFPNYILCETKGFDKRNVEKPQVEGVVKGPQEAYNESLRTNITLIRKILKNKDLTTEFFKLGERNNEQIAVLYINGLADPTVVAEVKRRLKGIVTDMIIGDGVLEQYIEDNPRSIYPTIISTERPDRTAAQLSEGKVAILAEGTPFALIVPVTIFDFLHSSEDTTLKWQYGAFLRFIRLFAVLIATLLPGLYVALTTYHREMIPTDLLIAIAQAKENVPFPTIVEVLVMELSFELIREAGIRIPGIIGNTIGIIGALILGQAAVQANLVSPVLIIVVAFTGLGNFAIPDFSMAFAARIMRLIYIVSGAVLGFFGVSLALLISLAVAVSENSFGVPFFSGYAPKTRKSSDLFLRQPIWKQELRPDYINALDVRRQPKISRKWILSKPKTTKNKKKDGK